MNPSVVASNGVENPELAPHTHYVASLAEEISRNINPQSPFWENQDKTMASVIGMGLKDANVNRGSYCFGVVEHPDLPQVIYKIVSTDWRIDPYILYAEWLFNERIFDKNPHFPRIHDIVYSGDGNVAIVTMEKLDHLGVFEEAPEWIQADFALYRRITRRIKKGYRGDVYQVPPGYTNRPLEAACDMLLDEFDEHSHLHFDSHLGNVLLRGDILVLIDPIALD